MGTRVIIRPVMLLILLLFISQVSSAVTIMTFNVENLFDTEDDRNRYDESFLPLKTKMKDDKIIKSCLGIRVFKWKKQCLYLDWTTDRLNQKMTNLSKVILSVGQGAGPDILVMQEVENIKVLKMFRDKFLKQYSHIAFIEGPDKRGIDIAILSKLKLSGSPQLHKIPFKKIGKRRQKDTRGILQAEFNLPDGKILSVFGVHFPAPFHPYRLREEALVFLNQLAKKVPATQAMVALGDFNIPVDEEARQGILKKRMGDIWSAPHLKGCDGCRGTTYYPPKKTWSYLDMILVAKGDRAWGYRDGSFKVINPLKIQKSTEGYPLSYDPETNQGVSDHWPLLVELTAK